MKKKKRRGEVDNNDEEVEEKEKRRYPSVKKFSKEMGCREPIHGITGSENCLPAMRKSENYLELVQ